MGDLVCLSFGPRRGLRKATSAVTWYERGCALEVCDPEGATAAYRRALAGRPDFADAHNNLGRLLHDRGDLVGAEAHYRLALRNAQDVALYWFNLGVALEDRGKTADAVAAYELALTRDPAMADAHFNLARQIERVARQSGDEVMLRRAIRHLNQYRELCRASG